MDEEMGQMVEIGSEEELEIVETIIKNARENLENTAKAHNDEITQGSLDDMEREFDILNEFSDKLESVDVDETYHRL